MEAFAVIQYSYTVARPPADTCHWERREEVGRPVADRTEKDQHDEADISGASRDCSVIRRGDFMQRRRWRKRLQVQVDFQNAQTIESSWDYLHEQWPIRVQRE
jgi:hypothetical protein